MRVGGPTIFAVRYEDVLVSQAQLKPAGISDPANLSWRGGVIPQFAVGDELMFTIQIPHAYVEGTTIYPHVHWTPHTRGNEENGNTVNWAIEYTIASILTVFPGEVIESLQGICSGTDHYHEIGDNSGAAEIDGTGIGISAIISGRIYRAAGDSWVTNTLGNRPALLHLDFHMLMDTIGSQSLYSKWS